ncbi:MAG TPA: lysylphosphatidylglycerol synthase transmembrane domain-containing protein [Myxococcota bacterium]|nr:lysylphosphatidylglycerol synthase transmembrane domain-containing protein [Myxococcota bacterium]
MARERGAPRLTRDDVERTVDALALRAPRIATRFGWLSGALLLAVLIIVSTHIAEERELARLLAGAEPFWLLGAALLQLLTYACASAVWQRALAYSGGALRLRDLLSLGLAKLFTDQALPSVGMSGTLLVVRGLQRRGVSRTAAVAAMLTGLVAFYLGYLIAILAAAGVLARHGEMHPLIVVPIALVGALAAGTPLAIFVLRRRAQNHAPRFFERWPGARDVVAALREMPAGTLFAPRLVMETTLLQLAIFVLDAGTLHLCLRAVGSPAPAPIAFASFIVASVVSSLSWMPGGLGAFEGSSVALLHLQGVPIEGALAATLLLRGMTFWLPMIPGFGVARREAAGAREEAR